VDLETGASTPLPESIVGTADVTGAYAVSPDGSRLAYVGRGDNGGVGIFVANIDGTGIEHVTVELRGEARPLAAPAPVWGAAPAWSPDGSKIAYVGLLGGWRGNVYLLDLARGVSTQLTDVQRGDSTSAPSFTPDGESIVYSVYSDPEVRIVPITGGNSVQLVGGDGKGASSPAPSPDGSLLSYACGVNGYDLCLANADGTDARVLVAGGGEPGGWSPDGTRIAYGGGLYVYVVDVATGERTLVARGTFPTWLDGHTLIVEADSCSLPPHKRCPF
jgi:Tol biopolymer transport system component